jgi:hypothetical protein
MQQQARAAAQAGFKHLCFGFVSGGLLEEQPQIT